MSCTRNNKVASKTTSIMKVRTLHESLNGTSSDASTGPRRFSVMKMKKKKNIPFYKPKRDDTRTIMPSEYCNKQQQEVHGNSNFTTRLKRKHNNTLVFHNVEVREYEVIPGCNPSITDGPPVEIGWRFSEGAVCSVDQFERSRCFRRRNKYRLRMPAYVRESLLILHGNDIVSIWKAAKEAKTLKIQRETTAAAERWKRKQANNRDNYLKKMLLRRQGYL